MLDNVKSDPFDIAKQNLIEPYGLTEGDLFDLHNKLEVRALILQIFTFSQSYPNHGILRKAL